jgi:hypothetical protein
MAWWAAFGCGFVAGLFVGQVTLAFFLALVRQDRAVKVVESPPLATELERLGPATSKSEVPAQSGRKETVATAGQTAAARPGVRGARLQ